MTHGPASSWFDTLRRDRRLFVLLASFIVLLQAMQPMALASQASGGGHFVICTDGDADPGQPLSHADCASCIASGCRVLPAAAQDSAAANTIIFAASDAIAISWQYLPCRPSADCNSVSLPPARGPPFIA